MTVISAHFDGKTIVPDEPVDLPSGMFLEVELRPVRDPFAHAEPVGDVSILLGGLPDERDADTILADIRDSRVPSKMS